MLLYVFVTDDHLSVLALLYRLVMIYDSRSCDTLLSFIHRSSLFQTVTHSDRNIVSLGVMQGGV